MNKEESTEYFYDVPILLIVFKRLETTKAVFERIRALRPSKLYIASDGPRSEVENEDVRVDEVRKYLLENIDWKCEYQTLFQESNLGCKHNPHNAITWFFQNEEMGIILEDDCTPSDSFFRFSKELLIKYREDLRIFGLTGSNTIEDHTNCEYSYYFSDYVQTWGWATWADRWAIHLDFLKNFDDYLDEPQIQTKLKNKIANEQIIHRARISHHDQLDTWDYQWFFTCFANNGLLIVPCKNLVQNSGFDEDATHTFNSKGKKVNQREIDFPLKHPKIVMANKDWDNIFYKKHYRWMTNLEKLLDLDYLVSFAKSRF